MKNAEQLSLMNELEKNVRNSIAEYFKGVLGKVEDLFYDIKNWKEEAYAIDYEKIEGSLSELLKCIRSILSVQANAELKIADFKIMLDSESCGDFEVIFKLMYLKPEIRKEILGIVNEALTLDATFDPLDAYFAGCKKQQKEAYAVAE